MTEDEWLTSECPYTTFQRIRHQASQRKLRLYACACCRQIWHLLPDQRSRDAVEMSELYADGRVTKEEMSAVQGVAANVVRDVAARTLPIESEFQPVEGGLRFEKLAAGHNWYDIGQLTVAAKSAKAVGRSTQRRGIVVEQMGYAAGWALSALAIGNQWPAIRQFRMAQANLLRDIFANPFHPIVINPAWLTPDVTAPAQTIYDERAFDRLPELGDALANGGCDNEDILGHCRSDGPHVRGCWVVDLVLGKE